VLLETVALCPHQSPQSPQTRYFQESCHTNGNQPKRPVAPVTNAGNPDRHDQSMAHGSRSIICQRAVGEHPLPGYGPVGLVKRPVRTRMLGVVGAGGEKPPATRLGFSITFSTKQNDCYQYIPLPLLTLHC
jgi:hypothetical protein